LSSLKGKLPADVFVPFIATHPRVCCDGEKLIRGKSGDRERGYGGEIERDREKDRQRERETERQ